MNTDRYSGPGTDALRRWEVRQSPCAWAMACMPAASVDAIVTDPPYGLGFMGKAWDASGVAYQPATWRQALRVLKPGGHLLAFGGTRTSHRLTCAIEDAGFEIRDTVAWLYGSGFPKSLNVPGAISPHDADGTTDPDRDTLAAPWQGWGTALKPAHEPIVVARKPLAGTVAANVLAHGTGALNVDGCRIGFAGNADEAESKGKNRHGDFGTEHGGNAVYGDYTRDEPRTNYNPPGRWPANVVMDPDAAAMLDAQTADLPGATSRTPSEARGVTSFGAGNNLTIYGDSGGASRFFYCAKASSAERNAGLDGFEAVHRANGNKWTDRDYRVERGERPPNAESGPRRNVHPTVKPVELMRWLVRLVTPPGGLVLDPFAGSGTTGVAALLEGARFVGVEREADYVAIARARLAWWAEHPDGMELTTRLAAEEHRRVMAARGQLTLFRP